MERIYITETPRDAIQGWDCIIRTEDKIEYINALLQVGFNRVDVGSYVSPRAIPQMADIDNVIPLLENNNSASKIMVIVGNVKGGLKAIKQDKIDIIGYPYSTSKEFLLRNLRSTPEKASATVNELYYLALDAGKMLQVYFSMAFGNPYGELYDPETIVNEAIRFYKMGVRQIALSDITDEANPLMINKLCSVLMNELPQAELILHLHTKHLDWQPKIEAAYDAGIRHFEGTIGGLGGCPMTGYELLGNLNTIALIEWADNRSIATGINSALLEHAIFLSKKIFVD